MAIVKKNTPPPVPPPAYTIELSEEEARGLIILLHGGVSNAALDVLNIEDLRTKLFVIAPPFTTAHVFQSAAILHPHKDKP